MPSPSVRLRPPLPWFLVGLLFVACGGGGGGSPVQPAAKANLAGQVRVPQLAPARLQPAADPTLPMVPGEVVVWLEDATNPPDLTAHGLDLARAPGGPVAVYRPRASLGRLTLAEGARPADSVEAATCLAADALPGAPGVRCASPNYLLRACVEPNDTFFDKQWHYPQINLPQAWDLTQGSASVVVAVLDTGIVASHPEFNGRLVAGIDMISNPAAARDGDGRDFDPEDVGDLATPQGSSFHGTHVAGTIGANGNDGAGVAGVDWNCRIMPIRVLGQGGGSVQDIADGILFAARLTNGSGQLPAQRADIVNMSLGGPGFSAVLEQACNAAANAGVLLVAAAGNDDSSEPNSPASFASVLSVGAVDLLRARAPYSNFSTTVDVWAPGGDMTADRNGDQFPDGVLSCMADDQGNKFFKFENGTSMASPHVAGVAALMKAADPTLTATQLRTLLLNTTMAGSNLPNGGRIVDALAAVQAANGGPPTQPLLVATPAAFDFGAVSTQASIELGNRGTGNLVFDSFTTQPAAPWLTATAAPVAAAGIDRSRIDLEVDRTGLPNGVLQTRLVANFLDGATTVAVGIDLRLQIGSAPASTDTVFVLLVDPLTLEARFQAETNAASGFRFAMAGIDAGDYLLVAGTDRNGDNFLGDAGELFGAWPNLDTPQVLTATAGQSLSDLDFGLQELAVVQSVGGARAAATYRRLR